MRGTMGQQGIKVTGNHEIDQAASELAIVYRDSWPGKPDQFYYDEAMRLRDEILRGAHYGLIRELAQNYRDGLLGAESAMDAIASAVLP